MSFGSHFPLDVWVERDQLVVSAFVRVLSIVAQQMVREHCATVRRSGSHLLLLFIDAVDDGSRCRKNYLLAPAKRTLVI